MEEKSRFKFIVIIAFILAVAVFYSFAVNVLQPTPSVGLAGPELDADPAQTATDPLEGSTQVDVTPETVQSVIATLNRYVSYQRTVAVEYLSGGEVTGTLSASVAVDGGWTRADVTGPGGLVEHTIVGDGSRWLWFGEERSYVQTPAGEAAADLAQRLPTYEDVLAVAQERITTAAYTTRGELACIYVEVLEPELGYLERYWVSVESGLLVCAETVKEDEVVYRMSSYEVASPLFPASDGLAQTDIFTLPDGTVLHQVWG